jgi:hypothetical protein
MSTQAFQEYQQLQDIIQQLQISQDNKDVWEYIWGGHQYAASKFYNLAYKFVQPPKPFLWIWDSRCSNKLRVFTWLLMMDRLNVRNILRRKKCKLEGNDYSCPLCPQSREETTFHLFFSCPFSVDCWNHLGIIWNSNLGFHQMLEEAKKQCNHMFFMEIFMLGAWLIWKQRNDAIFNRGRPSFQKWKLSFLGEAQLQTSRMAPLKKLVFSVKFKHSRYDL